METTKQIIDFTKGVYNGTFAKELTLTNYISALDECAARYASKQRVEKWLTTSYFGFGEGHNTAREVLCLGQGSMIVVYINRYFLQNESLRKYAQMWHKFDHTPVGGKLIIGDFIEYLKTLNK